MTAIRLTQNNEPDHPENWIVQVEGDDHDRYSIGDVTHVSARHWVAETMDGLKFRAPSRREAIQRLRIHAAA